MAKDIFNRLAQGRPPSGKKTTDQRRRNADRIARGIQETNAKVFLMDALQNGPVPAAIIKELGAARGFDRARLWEAKQQIRAGSFKMKGKFNGCWFWTLTQHTPEWAVATKPDDRHARRLRDLSRKLGFRLRPIGLRRGPPTVRPDRQK